MTDHPLKDELRRAEALHRSGQSQEAARLLVSLVRSGRESADLYQLLADIERSRGRRTAEAAVLEELLVLTPLDPAAWQRLGALRMEQGRWEDAVRAFRRAVSLLPDQAAGWEGLALAAVQAQQLSVAREANDQLLACFPMRAFSRVIAGHIHKAQGEPQEAAAAYEEALRLDPASSEAFFNLVDLKAHPPGHPRVVQAAHQLERTDVSDETAANLHFGLGRVQEAAGDTERAFLRYQSANAAVQRSMKRRGVTYSEQAAEERISHTIATYPTSSFRQPLEPLPIGMRMIFIVGMPRSGTTLLEQILSSHPQVAAGGELNAATECERLYTQRRAERNLRGPIDPASDQERDLLAEAREIYLDRLFERDLDADYVTDKLPGNFARLGFIRLMFPDAIILHSRRDPVATCWSLFTSNFAMHDPYCNDLQHLAHYYRSYERITGYWKSVLAPPPIDVHYEAIVSSPEEQIRNLLGAIGLPWNDRCLAFHENARPVFTASQQQVRQPTYTTSIDRWRLFEKHLAALRGLRQPSGRDLD